MAELTGRQSAVLDLLAVGATTHGIARTLSISTPTAHSYVRDLLSKMGVHSRLEAVLMAQEYGLVDLPRLG